MASLLFGAGVLAYDQIQKKRDRKKSKTQHNSTRFSELERENADRIAALQQNTCFCQRSDWRGGGCEVHGYVPPAAGARSGAGDGDGRGEVDVDGVNGPGALSRPPEYTDVTAAAEPGEGNGQRGQNRGLRTEGWTERPPRMEDDEIEKINEERRKRMKARSGYKKWFGRKRSADV